MSQLSANEVAARLGVKLDTVYAYVSRGVLSAHHTPGSRLSRFDATEVERLALRGRPRRNSRPSALDIVVHTELTTIVEQRLLYRGRDACQMARSHTFEQAAEWLWTATDAVPGRPWVGYPSAPVALSEPRDRIRSAVVMASPQEPFGADLSPRAVTATGRKLIASMVDALPATPGGVPRLALARDGRRISGSLAGRLWSRLSPGRAPAGLVATLNAALVLLLDHELASSTMAARVAASVRADPFSVVLAGLGTVAGPMHGGASALTHAMLTEAIEQTPSAALAAALQRHGFLPGFGHGLYPDGDPRARVLLGMIEAAMPRSPGLRAAHALTRAAREHAQSEPNVDLALAVLSIAAGMPASAGETIFTIARSAGWIAHGLEEYSEAPVRFRARAVQKRPHG